MGHEDSPPKLLETPLMDGHEMNKKVVDLSPFFLFEAIGDSEGDFDHQSMMMKMMMVGRLGDVHNHDDVDDDKDEDDDDDDDAESCSNDVWDRDTSHANGIGAHRGTNHDNQHHYDDDDDDDIDGHKVMKGESSKGYHDGNAWNESSRYDHDHDHNNNNNKSTSEVMSTANSHASRNSSCEGKQMSEKERSRLFWEACLAS